MILVGLTGVARSGKDTVGQILVKKRGFERRAFADKLRAVAYGASPLVRRNEGDIIDLARLVDMVGWEKAKAHTDVRGFLQRLGTEGVRNNLGEHAWVLAGVKDLVDTDRVVFTDVRFGNEAFAIRERGGEVWRVERPGFGPINNHVSDAGLDDGYIDRVIVNDGTLGQLYDKVLRDWTPS